MTIADTLKPKPNYSKQQIEDRLFQAIDKMNAKRINECEVEIKILHGLMQYGICIELLKARIVKLRM